MSDPVDPIRVAENADPHLNTAADDRSVRRKLRRADERYEWQHTAAVVVHYSTDTLPSSENDGRILAVPKKNGRTFSEPSW